MNLNQNIDISFSSGFKKIKNAVAEQSVIHKLSAIAFSVILSVIMTFFIANTADFLLKIFVFIFSLAANTSLLLIFRPVRKSPFWYYKCLFLLAYAAFCVRMCLQLNLNILFFGENMSVMHVIWLLLLAVPGIIYIILHFIRKLLVSGHRKGHKIAGFIMELLGYYSPLPLTKKQNSCSGKPHKSVIHAVVLFLIAAILFMTAFVLRSDFPHMKVESIAFTLQFLNQATNPKIVQKIIGYAAVVFVSSGLFGALSAYRSSRKDILLQSPDGSDIIKHYSSSEKYRLWPARLLLCLCFLTLLGQCGVHSFIIGKLTDSHIYENYYVKPDPSVLSFPAKKKNLIYIYLESYENTFASKANGGNQSVDYMPELEQLAADNINFSNTSGLGGQSVFFPNISYTMGSTVAQTGGISLTTPMGGMRNQMSSLNAFLPSLIRLEDILHDEGYNQMFIRGEDTNFAAYNKYVGRYDNSTIFDCNTAIELNYLDPKDKNTWGYEDVKLFSYAKDLISGLAAKDAPFCATLYTVDTHSPEQGFRCEMCDPDIPDQLTAAIRCSSKQVSDFVQWITQQDFYDDTVIILVGDHLIECTTDYLDFSEKNYKRTTFNCIINSDTIPVNEKNRVFSAPDMFPTTLSAIGVSIKGDRLGLGTDLFSGTPTLCEELGVKKYLRDIQSSSDYYTSAFWNSEN